MELKCFKWGYWQGYQTDMAPKFFVNLLLCSKIKCVEEYRPKISFMFQNSLFLYNIQKQKTSCYILNIGFSGTQIILIIKKYVLFSILVLLPLEMKKKTISKND